MCKAVVTMMADDPIMKDVPDDTINDSVVQVVEIYLHVEVILLTEIL